MLFSISFPLEMVLRSIEEVKIPLYATILSLITNIVFNYVFIFFLGWDVKGAALATVTARLVECIYLYGTTYKRKLPQIAKISEYLNFHRNFVARFLKIAFPVVINETLWGLRITIENGNYAHVSTNALAAFNMCMVVGVMRAGGDTVYGGIADIGGLWNCGLVCGTIAAFVLHLEPWLVFAAFCMEESLKFIMGVIRLKSGKWLHNVVDSN